MPRLFVPRETRANDPVVEALHQQKQRRMEHSNRDCFELDIDDGDGSSDDGSQSTTDEEHTSSPDLLDPRNLGGEQIQFGRLPQRRVGCTTYKCEDGIRKDEHEGTLGPRCLREFGSDEVAPKDRRQGVQRADDNVDGKIDKESTEAGTSASQKIGPSHVRYYGLESGDSHASPQKDRPRASDEAASCVAQPANSRERLAHPKGSTGSASPIEEDRAESECGRQTPKESEQRFVVVFTSNRLGLTLADDTKKGSPCVVVCDKAESATTPPAAPCIGHPTSSPSDTVRIGDRIVAVGGINVVSSSLADVERMLIRGPRPLEVVFQRAHSMSRRRVQGSSPKIRTGAPDESESIAEDIGAPLCGLERPSHDSLLDVISDLASREYSLHESQLLSEQASGPLRQDALSSAMDTRSTRPQHGDGERNRYLLAGETMVSGSALSLNEDCGRVEAITNKTYTNTPGKTCHPEAVRHTVKRGSLPAMSEVAERPHDTYSDRGCTRAADPVIEGHDDGGVNTKNIRTKRPYGVLDSKQKPERCRPRAVKLCASRDVDRSARSKSGAPPARTLSSVMQFAKEDVARILKKLGPKGVSELTLYRKLTFDELVGVCRYVGIDVSKRLPKTTMAERLNAVYMEKGAQSHELRMVLNQEERDESGALCPAMTQASAPDKPCEYHSPHKHDALPDAGRPLPVQASPLSTSRELIEPPIPTGASSSRRPHNSGDPAPGPPQIPVDDPFCADGAQPLDFRSKKPRSAAGLTRSRGTYAEHQDSEDQAWEDWDYRAHAKTRAGPEEKAEEAWWLGDSDSDWSPCSSPPSFSSKSEDVDIDDGGFLSQPRRRRNHFLPAAPDGRTGSSWPGPPEVDYSVLPRWTLWSVRTIGTQVTSVYIGSHGAVETAVKTTATAPGRSQTPSPITR